MRRNIFLMRWIVFAVLLLGALVLTQRVADRHDRRLDLTEAKLSTISPETARILSRIEDKVTITYFASERVPAGFQNLRRDTIDFLEEYERTSGGRVEVRAVDPYTLIEDFVEEKKAEREAEKLAKGTNGDSEEGPDDSADPGTEEALATNDLTATAEERQELVWADDKKKALAGEGVPELRGQSIQDDSFGYVNFYSTIEIRYLDRDPQYIPVHQRLEGFEYELASRIVKMTATDKPKVAFFLGKKDDVIELPRNPQLPPDMPPQTMHVYEPLLRDVLEEQFTVEQIDLTEESGIPGDAKLLIVAEPHLLNDRQVYEIDRSVATGRPTIFLVSSATGSLEESTLGLSPLEPRLNTIFEKWGLSMGREVVSSLECGTIEVVRSQQGIRFRRALPFPLCPQVRGRGLNQESPLSQGLASLVFPFATALQPNPLVLEQNGITFTPLATTDKQAWLSHFTPTVERGMMEVPGDPSRRKTFVLAALLEGKFPMRFRTGDPIPRWKSTLLDENGDPGTAGETAAEIELIPPLESAPGRVVVIGSADIGKYAALSMYRQSSSNLSFLSGIVETLALGQDLVQIRAKAPIPRPLDDTTSSQRWWASYGNIVGVPIAILLLALCRFLLRRTSARAYEARFVREGG